LRWFWSVWEFGSLHSAKVDWFAFHLSAYTVLALCVASASVAITLNRLPGRTFFWRRFFWCSCCRRCGGRGCGCYNLWRTSFFRTKKPTGCATMASVAVLIRCLTWSTFRGVAQHSCANGVLAVHVASARVAVYLNRFTWTAGRL